MEIFKKVSDSARTLTEGAKTISKKSSDLVGVAKLKYEITKLQKEMENNKAALGSLVYLRYKGEKDLEGEIDRLLNNTQALENEIAEIEAQIAKYLPKPPVCPKCMTELPSTAKYCFICGTQVTQNDPIE